MATLEQTPLSSAHANVTSLRVSVVIPALNEAANLPHVLPRIPAWIHELILVDGESTDGTVEVARSLWPEVKIVDQPRPGKGCALRAGFEAATGDMVVMLDADGSTNPAEIPRFVDTLLSGADFAKGSRFLPDAGSDDISWLRSAGNAGLLSLVRWLFGCPYTDLCYGYNALWRRAIPVLDLEVDGFEIETVMNLRAAIRGLRVVEVPSFEAKRLFGTSRLNTFRDGWRVLKAIWRERAMASKRLAATPEEPALPLFREEVQPAELAAVEARA